MYENGFVIYFESKQIRALRSRDIGINWFYQTMCFLQLVIAAYDAYEYIGL